MQSKQATQENTYWQTKILPTNPPQLVETMVVMEDVDPIQPIMELNQIIIEKKKNIFRMLKKVINILIATNEHVFDGTSIIIKGCRE
jgi:hypothetical protein